MNTSAQQEVLEWFKEWKNLSCSREQLLSMTRGPFRDFQIGLLLPQVRTNAYIETYRTNAYLQEGGARDSKDSFLKNEIESEMFSEKMAQLAELTRESNQLKSQVDLKQEAWRLKRMPRAKSLYSYKKDYYDTLEQRVSKTEAMIAECDKLTAVDYPGSPGHPPQVSNESRLPKLTEAAHLALQTVIMRHFLHENLHSSPSIRGCIVTTDEFNNLVYSVIHEDGCGSRVFSWVDKERMNGFRSCETYTKRLLVQDRKSGLQQSMSEKMNDLVVSWSATHVQACFKNKARSKMLKEVNESIEEYRKQLAQGTSQNFYLSDFVHLLREAELKEKVIRCHQYSNRSQQPLENMFKNISTDNFSTPSPEDFGNTLTRELRRHSNLKEWVTALSDSEHIQEIYAVLLKTWKMAKKNLGDMMSFAQLPNSELLPNLLQTAESIRVTMPKPMPHLPELVRHRANTHDITLASTLSITRSSMMDTTIGVCESFNDSRASTATKNSTSESENGDVHELFALYDRIPKHDPPALLDVYKDMFVRLTGQQN